MYVDAGVGVRGKYFARAIAIVSLHSEEKGSCGGTFGKPFRHGATVATKLIPPHAGPLLPGKSGCCA